MIGVPGVVSADDVCHAVEQILREHLADTVEQLQLTERLRPIKTWQQLPEARALVSAQFPTAAITSPGLSGNPTTQGAGVRRATWRVGVAFYDRGIDHADTQGRIRDWAAAARVTLLAHRSLGGLAETLTWVGEEYALYPQKEAARTIGGSAVAVDVTVTDVAFLPPATPDPDVQSVHIPVTPVPAP